MRCAVLVAVYTAGMLTIPTEVEEQLGIYVYAYIDPRTNRVFYVGKGQSGRVLSHLTGEGESRKRALIAEIQVAGLEPQLDIVQHGIPDEETALRIEAALIDMLGLDVLINEVHGWRHKFLGRAVLPDLIGRYSRPIKISEPCILIRINKLYRPGMSEKDLYESTRGIWKVGDRRSGAKFALAVYRGVVREVYRIDGWHPAGTTAYDSRTFTPAECANRSEFVGSTAPEEIRKQFLFGNVSNYLSDGSQNPISYVCC